MIFFPIHVGLASKAFNQQKTIVINNFGARPQTDFVNVVDNPKDIKKINNYMVGCLKNLDGRSVGLVQLSNIKQKTISKIEVKRFEAIAKFFGGCIENIQSKTTKLTTTLVVEENINEANKHTNLRFDSIAKDGTLTTYTNLRKFVEALQDLIKLETNNHVQLGKLLH